METDITFTRTRCKVCDSLYEPRFINKTKHISLSEDICPVCSDVIEEAIEDWKYIDGEEEDE